MDGGGDKGQDGITIGINWGNPKTSFAISPSSSRIVQASSVVELLESVKAILFIRLDSFDGMVAGRDPFSGFPPRIATMQRALIVRSSCAVKVKWDRVDFG